MPTQCRLLLVEPNAPLRRELAELLAPALDAAVEQRDDLAGAREVAAGCDALLLDWDVAEADPDGVRALMAGGDGPGLLVLGATEAQLRGLHAAAGGREIEAVERPVRFADLALRLREQLRRRWEAVGPRVGRFRFDPEGKRLLPPPPEEPVRLTEKEAGILDHLYRQDGAVVERETLLRALWGYEPGATTHTLETHIYRLRQKLEADPSNARILLTVNGGYRLVTTPPEREFDEAAG